MKAVLIERPHEVAWVELETPTVGPGEVLVRSHAAGVCRTDLEILHGALAGDLVRFPLVPGHEWSGTVAELGDGVTKRSRDLCSLQLREARAIVVEQFERIYLTTKLREHGGRVPRAAEAMGVSRQTIIAIETERYTPSLPLAIALARYFELPVEEVFHADRTA